MHIERFCCQDGKCDKAKPEWIQLQNGRMHQNGINSEFEKTETHRGCTGAQLWCCVMSERLEKGNCSPTWYDQGRWQCLHDSPISLMMRCDDPDLRLGSDDCEEAQAQAIDQEQL